MKTPTTGIGDSAEPANFSATEGDPKKNINVELWQACAGPLVTLPASGTHVVYFPQGHSEQVAASMKKDMDAQVPNYPNLPSKLLCVLHSITLQADPETDEVYAQMTLQPVPSFDKDALLRSDLSMRANKPQMEFFCKTLTASDTSTHGGFSVPRRAAEKIFPPLDFTMQPPAQELVARDLHDSVWTFRHIYRGQPKRHLLTTGWSLFVSGKRLIAGDSVLFIRDEKHHLLLGIRRSNRQPTNLSSSVLSSDSMHIGILAAAAHAAANNSPFTVFYNPRASPSEFIIPLSKYYKAVCSNQISLGMRFRMMFETEESGTRRYMGTIAGISDLDPVRWKNSQWRNLQVGWDETTAGEKRNRVSIWEIEPVTAPFFICPTPPFLCSKRPRQPGMPDDDTSDIDALFRRAMPWLGDDFGLKDPQALPGPGLSLAQWMNMQQHSSLANSMQPTTVFQNHNSLQLNAQRPTQPPQDQLPKVPSSSSNPAVPTILPQQQHLSENTQQLRQNLSASLTGSDVSAQILQSPGPIQAQNLLQQQHSLLDQQLWRNMTRTLPYQHQQTSNGPNLSPSPQPVDHLSQQLHIPDSQVQLQLLQKLQQQNSLLAHQSGMPQASQMPDAPKELLDVPSNFSRPVTANQMVMDASQPTPSFQKMVRNDSQNSILFSSPQQSKPQQLQQSGVLSESHGHLRTSSNPLSKQLSAGSSSLLTGAAARAPSAITEDAPSCSTSPSSNCQNAPPSTILLNSSGQEPMSSIVKEFRPQSDARPLLNTSKSQNQGFFASQMYPNHVGGHIDYLDSSSSATSVLSQNDAQVPQNNSFNSQSILFRDVNQEIEVHGNPRNNLSFGSNAMNQLEMAIISDPLMTRDMAGSAKDFSTNISSGGIMLPNYETPKETQPDFSSSMVSQSFGVPDMTFNSIDSTINDGSSYMNRGSWAPSQVPRLRTYTKVYKRGAVGRSIDITGYSGYDELKQDLAHRFGIEGQLEGHQRIGWKLVYVDHENDVLLVGDDPWEEFVSCVRCIKILSPQEVQQMSLDGDFGHGVIPNQACSSSDIGLS